jgi:hypothetical protein
MGDNFMRRWQEILGSLVCVAANAGCAAQPLSANAYWDQAPKQVVQVTCGGQLYDGAGILALSPNEITGKCFYFRGPFEVSDWLSGTAAVVYSNQILIDGVRSFSSRIVPGGIFIGEAAFPFQGLDGRERTIFRLRDLHTPAES